MAWMASYPSIVRDAPSTDRNPRLCRDAIKSKYSNALKPRVIALPAPNGLGKTLTASFWDRVTWCYVRFGCLRCNGIFSQQPYLDSNRSSYLSIRGQLA